jgi:TonB family protein
MKKNNMFYIMLSFSAILHGLILFGTAKNVFRIPLPVSENRYISTLKIIKANIAPQNSVPDEPPEEKIVEKPIEPLPDPNPVQEENPIEPLPESNPVQETEYAENTVVENIKNDEEVQHGIKTADDNGEITSNEYKELLAYIKEFIKKNLSYPSMARQRNIQGIVGVSFEIEMDGEIVSISVAHSSGSSILDNAAVSLIKKIHPLENIVIKRKLALKVNIDYKLTE